MRRARDPLEDFVIDKVLDLPLDGLGPVLRELTPNCVRVVLGGRDRVGAPPLESCRSGVALLCREGLLPGPLRHTVRRLSPPRGSAHVVEGFHKVSAVVA